MARQGVVVKVKAPIVRFPQLRRTVIYTARNPDRRFSPGPPAALNRRSRSETHRGNDANGLARA